MEPHESYWHEVNPSAYILDPDGQTIWKVMAEREVAGDDGNMRPQVLLAKRDGTTKLIWRPGPFERVTFMRRTLEETEELVAARLGATLVARKQAKHYECLPINPKSLAEMRSHLMLFHGTYVGDVKTGKGLIECHRSQHEDAEAGVDQHAYVLHTHTARLRPLGASR